MIPSRNFIRSGSSLICNSLITRHGFTHVHAKKSISVLISQPKRLAGHSHWQNVKSFKEAKDQEKSKVISFYVRAVGKAIRDGGGNRDPKLNQRLASVLADAKANSVPFTTLERVLKQDNSTDPYVVEVKAQGGLFVLVESRAKSMSMEKQKLTALVKKFGCTVSQSTGNIAKEFFDHIGIVVVPCDPSNLPDLDSALNLGIEVGATDVQHSSEDGQDVYNFYCLPNEVNRLRARLEEHKIEVLDAQDVYVPKVTVAISAEVRENLDLLYERIRSQHDQVNRIFDNTKCDEQA